MQYQCNVQFVNLAFYLPINIVKCNNQYVLHVILCKMKKKGNCSWQCRFIIIFELVFFFTVVSFPRPLSILITYIYMCRYNIFILIYSLISFYYLFIYILNIFSFFGDFKKCIILVINYNPYYRLFHHYFHCQLINGEFKELL